MQRNFLDIEAEHDPEELKYKKVWDALKEDPNGNEDQLDKTDEELVDRNELEFD